MVNNKLPHRLKNLREEKGYLQKHVADEIGVKNNTLSGYESGSRSPDPEMIVELAKLYDVSTDYLLGKNDNKYTIEHEDLEAFIEELRYWYNKDPQKGAKKLHKLKQIFRILNDEEA
ncbi:helix-turn-helix domain-containing protein [Pseudogracilibacillus sp. ICA-222130]|uniref:helix-turn-helix domain-containing protein n=1 Tax=Pseudogracilibacillus sp. ICA-222130 TaxID=3134655 RepID=UPI0030BCEE80